MFKAAATAALATKSMNSTGVSGGFGLGEVPQMGWSSWNVYQCDIDAEKIKA
jgi:hypothetical protein